MVIGNIIDDRLKTGLHYSVFTVAGLTIDNGTNSSVWVLVDDTIWNPILNVIGSVNGVR